ncbi:MAG: hypothetical protein RIC35_17815 [Marinoscillum sp.]
MNIRNAFSILFIFFQFYSYSQTESDNKITLTLEVGAEDLMVENTMLSYTRRELRKYDVEVFSRMSKSPKYGIMISVVPADRGYAASVLGYEKLDITNVYYQYTSILDIIENGHSDNKLSIEEFTQLFEEAKSEKTSDYISIQNNLDSYIVPKVNSLISRSSLIELSKAVAVFIDVNMLEMIREERRLSDKIDEIMKN